MKRFFLLIISTLLVLSSCSSRQALKCNYSSVDISTLEGEHVVLAGFAARQGLSDTIHTRLRSSALAITNGSEKVLVVSNDMMEISPELTAGIRSEISKRSGLSENRILLHCIHTHSAPRTGGVSGSEGGPNYEYKMRTFEAIIANAVKVVTDEKAYQPFHFEVAKGQTSINENRCEANGPADHDLYAVKLVGKKPICAFINLSCHPVCMGHKSHSLSADYSGVARMEIAQKWGCEVFQFTGASGNMNPVGGCRDKAHANEVGGTLAAELAALEFEKVPSKGILNVTNRTVSLPYRIANVSPEAVKAHADSLINSAKTSFPRFANDVRNWEKDILNKFAKGTVKNTLDFELAGINADGIGFIFTQGEPFSEYQAELRKSFPGQTLIFAAYTSGQNSYLPSAHAYKVHKGYEYEIDQMHIYIRAPYPLSNQMPSVYAEGLFKTAAEVLTEPRYSVIPLPNKIEASYQDYTFNSKPKVKYKKVEGIAEEGYILDITPRGAKVQYSSEAGKFYASKTIEQLAKDGTLPCCHIEDAPKFAYRGMMLDCGRYFFDVETVKKFLDLMALHKQNVLHWHLTEDQGWRIEIKKYPLLTQVGAYRKETAGYKNKPTPDRTPHGGFYTQEQIKDIVAYASQRHITVIPELEIPGHSSAAIAAYPYLSCTPNQPKEVATNWGVMEDVYCPSPKTFAFLEDVLSEMFELFPSEYYHFGGDECPTTAWDNSEYCKQYADSLGLSSTADIQDVFVKHFEKFLQEHGKKVIGWDEILNGEPSKETVVMSYRGHNPAKKAFDRGMNVVLCPNRWTYLDYEQEQIEDIPQNQHLFITLRKSYNYNYLNFLPGSDAEKSDSLLLGLQGCVWGEYMPDVPKLEYLTYPRSSSLAELSWTCDESRNWNSFRTRIEGELKLLEKYGIQNYSRANKQVIVNMDLTLPYPREVELQIDYPTADIRYTLDGTEPSFSSPIAPKTILIDKGQTLCARGFLSDGTSIGKVMKRTF